MRALFYLGLLTGLAACQGKPLMGVSPIVSQPEGKFVSEEKIEDPSSFRTVGCNRKIPGFDDRLEPRDIFTTAFRSVSYNGVNMHGRIKEEILASDTREYKSKATLLEIEGVEGLQAGMVIQNRCRYHNSRSKQCSATPSVKYPNMQWCTIQDTDSFEPPVYSQGLFQLKGETQPVLAYRISYRVRGTVVCGKTAMGKGEMLSVVIKSNDIKSMESDYCGGTTIFVYFQTALSNQIMSTGRFEILSTH